MNKFISNRKWVISTVAVLILSGLLFWLQFDRKKEKHQLAKEQQRQIQVEAEAAQLNALIQEQKNWLEKATDLLYGADSTAFYTELNAGVKSYLSAKLQLPLETINKKNVVEALDQKNIPVGTSLQLQELMNDIDLQLYTPFAAAATDEGKLQQRQRLHETATDLIQLLDTYKI